ncbi:MAG: sigma 54-interacting transcriptional regulator [Acidobacteriota bacterium]
MPWYKAFDQPYDRRHDRAAFSAVIARAEAAFDSGEYNELIELIEAALEQGDSDPEQRVLLRCLLNEAFCELNRYEEAAAALACYESEPLLLPDKLQAELLLRIGATCTRLSQYPRAMARLTEALRLFTLLSDNEGITRGYFELSQLYVNINEYTIARDYLARALGQAESLANRRLMAQILLRLGLVAHFEGDFGNAKLSYCRALKLVEGSCDYRLLGYLEMNLATTLFFEENSSAESAEQVISLNESAIENFKKLPNLDAMANCYNNLGDSLLRFGMWEKARQVLEQAIEVARTASHSYHEGLALITLGVLNLRRGELVTAKRFLVAAVKIIEHNDKAALAHAKRVLGYTYKEGTPSALKAFNSSLQLALAVGDHSEIIFSQLALVEYYYVRQDYEQAYSYLKEAQERLNHKPSPYISGFVQRFTGKLRAIDGPLAEAVQHITASVSIFTAMGDRYELGRSNLELAAVLAKSENFDKAETHIKQAIEILQELDTRPELERALQVKEYIDRQLSIRSGAVVPQLEQVSDLSLLKRLAQACITSDILLQEFAAIVFESMRLRRLIIFQPASDSPALLLAYGCSREEAQHQRTRLEAYLEQERKQLINGTLIKIAGARHPDFYCYFETVQGSLTQRQLERIDLFLEYVKLGLENCALRSSTHTETAANWSIPNTREPHTLIQGFVYSSPTICRVVEQIKKIRTSDVTVLITGESGTGKELVARAIHAESARREGAFVAFNCTATPRELIESQLFGHRRGSFTGATSNYLGVIRTAKGGTLFLDEIGDLNLELQPKLLRFLEAGEIQPLGEGRPLKVDVRVIAATNADLAQAVAERRFREDLYHRLNIIRIHIPPLRERAEEIPMLLNYYLNYFSARYSGKQISFSDATITALQRYHWPGNVRQLRNEIERLITYSGKGDLISITDLSPDIRQSVAPAIVPVNTRTTMSTSNDSARVVELFSSSQRKLRDVVRPIERELIINTLARNRGNLSKTAKDLGMSRRGLRLKIESLEINTEESDDS